MRGGGRIAAPPAALAVCLVALVAGCLTAWCAYFAAALLAAHAFWAGRRGPRPVRGLPLVLAGCAVAVFAAFLLHRQMLLGTGAGEAHGTLLEKLLARTAYLDLGIPTADGLVPVGPARFGMHLAQDLVRMHGPVTLLLVGWWLLGAVRRATRRSWDSGDTFLAILLGYGLLHGMAFPMLLPGHDFLSRSFAVGFAVAAAVAITDLSRRFAPTSDTRATALTVGLLMLVLASNLPLGVGLSGRTSDGELTKARGTWIAGATDPETVVLLPVRPDQVLKYYADRRMSFGLTTPEALDSVLRGPRAVALAIPERDSVQYQALAVAANARGAEAASWRGLRLYLLPPATSRP